MDIDPDPKKTYALVVGIEKYDDPKVPDLNGPARNAVDFAKWLLKKEVSKDNIGLFISPLNDENNSFIEEANLNDINQEATSTKINNHIEDKISHHQLEIS